MFKAYWLLLLVPLTLAVRYAAPSQQTIVFVLAACSMIPLAQLLSEATEQTAERTGPTVGALLNVTFGNAGELLIGFFALRSGLQQLVKASITGSILVNLLFTLGASMLLGGLRRKTLSFNPLAARTQTTMMSLAAIALILPAAFSIAARSSTSGSSVQDLSLAFSVVLLVLYGLSLLFTLRTHTSFLRPTKVELPTGHQASPSIQRSLFMLGTSSFLIAWMGEVLVGSIEQAAKTLGMTDLFAGLIVVALAGNAAESTAAVKAALRDRMDLSVGIATGSSIQIALFVAPVLVIASLFLHGSPMNLIFSPLEIVSLVLAVSITVQIASDGDSNWLEGALLLAVYAMLAVVFFFLPNSSHA